MNIKFRGQYEKKQYFKGMALAAKQPMSKTLGRVALFLGFTAIYVVLVYHTLGQEEISTHELGRAIRHLLTVGILGYAIFRPAINTYSTANKLWKDPIIRALKFGTITDEGICFYDKVTYGWDRFIFKRMTDELVVLLTVSSDISIFPKHFFEDENDWNEFRQVVEFKVIEVE